MCLQVFIHAFRHFQWLGGRGQWPCLFRGPHQVQGHFPWPWNFIYNPRNLLYLSGRSWLEFSIRGLMGQWTNSNIRRTVTDRPFLHVNMSKRTFNPKKKNPYGATVLRVQGLDRHWESGKDIYYFHIHGVYSKISNRNNEFCCLHRNIYLSEDRFGKSTHISMISNSVTHLRSYTNSAITKNSPPISPGTPRERRYHRIEWQVFCDVSQCFKGGSGSRCFMTFHDVSQCFTRVSWCFTMFFCV